MSKVIFLIGLLISIITTLFVFLPQVAARTIIPEHVIVDEVARQTILKATVKISFFAPAYDENGQPKVTIVNGQRQTEFTGGTGLGTVALIDQETVIITHDHWGLLDNPQAIVELATASGELLHTISAPEFGNLIRYRDGGTMILNLPDALAGNFQPAVSGDANTVARNDVLLMAYRQPAAGDNISVEAVVVSRQTWHGGLATLELTSPSGKIVITGNSGGGVWADGKLVANMWSTLLKQTTATGEITSTDQSRAALLPAGI